MKISHILLVFSAILCIPPSVVAQQSRIPDETVIIQVDDHLITSADTNKEARRLLYQNPASLHDQSAQDKAGYDAVVNLVRQALALQVVAKLEVPVAHYRSVTDEFVLKEIERAGSINDFLLEKNNELGVLDIEEFSDYIYRNFIYTYIIRTVVGNQETAGKGLRAILGPSPAEVRRAYKENQKFRMAPAVLRWNYLKFRKNSDSGETPKQIVTKALTDLSDGSINVQGLIDLADDAIPGVGQPEETADWIFDFVSSASTGEYIIAPKNNSGSQGSVGMVVVTENVPAQEYTFEEAQPIIIKWLTGRNRAKALGDFFTETAAVVDVWVTDDIPGLKKAVSRMIGRDIPVNNPEEL